MASIAGKVVVVTGASSGIGSAIAERLAVQSGALVVMGARRVDRLEELADRIKAAGGKCDAIKLDVGDKASVKEFFDAVYAKYERVDILVNNAGVYYLTLIENVLVDQWDDCVKVNINGVLNCVAAVVQKMVAAKSGHILNISSDSGRWTWPGSAVYTGTKFFMEGFSGSLRKEMAEHNVKVTTVLPGLVGSTDGFKHTTDKGAQAKFNINPEIMDSLVPDDIARAVEYALSQPPNCAVNEVLVQHASQPA